MNQHTKNHPVIWILPTFWILFPSSCKHFCDCYFSFLLRHSWLSNILFKISFQISAIFCWRDVRVFFKRLILCWALIFPFASTLSSSRRLWIFFLVCGLRFLNFKYFLTIYLLFWIRTNFWFKVCFARAHNLHLSFVLSLQSLISSGK